MSAITIPPRSGTAFTLSKGSFLTVIDPEGEQVSDLVPVVGVDEQGDLFGAQP